jgi:predicted membrane protein (TIGR00267 family)
MKRVARTVRRGHLLPAVLGVTDGILTALTLAAGRLVEAAARIDITFALRIAAGALLSSAFVFFVARYAELRGELIHAEQQLNLAVHGRLATTRLGRVVFREALVAAATASACAFVGALVPLLAAVLLPGPSWLAIAVAVIALGALGHSLASVLHGNQLRWTVSLVAGGVLLSLAGIALQIA